MAYSERYNIHKDSILVGAPLVEFEQRDSKDGDSHVSNSDTKDDSELQESDFDSDSTEVIAVPSYILPRDGSYDIFIPLNDLQISRDGLSAHDFSVPTCEEFQTAQSNNTDLSLLRESINRKVCPSIDKLAPLSGRMKSYDQVINEISLRKGILITRRHDASDRDLISVSHLFK